MKLVENILQKIKNFFSFRNKKEKKISPIKIGVITNNYITLFQQEIILYKDNLKYILVLEVYEEVYWSIKIISVEENITVTLKEKTTWREGDSLYELKKLALEEGKKYLLSLPEKELSLEFLSQAHKWKK